MKVFKPKNNWVLVDPEPIKETYGTSFVVADDVTKRSEAGKVLDIGDDIKGVKAGDNILFQRNGVVPIVVNDEDRLLVNKQQILGTYE